jgi:predicted O-methyltransferase YrrM
VADARPRPAVGRAPAVSEDEIAGWYADKSFSSDWTSWHFANWAALLHPLRDEPVRVLEIGSWEGRSALFFLNYLSRSNIACVDTFGGNIEHMRNPHFAALVPETEQRFDANLACFERRLEKIKGASAEVLPQLGIAARRFELVYVDGSHRAADVYADGVLAWPMLARDGILIFDDYEFDEVADDSERPKLGIDAFLAAFAGQYRVLHKSYQVIIAKL